MFTALITFGSNDGMRKINSLQAHQLMLQPYIQGMDGHWNLVPLGGQNHVQNHCLKALASSAIGSLVLPSSGGRGFCKVKWYLSLGQNHSWVGGDCDAPEHGPRESCSNSILEAQSQSLATEACNGNGIISSSVRGR